MTKFEESAFALAFHWRQNNYDANLGAGVMMLNVAPAKADMWDCGSWNGMQGNTFLQSPFDKTSAWKVGTKLKEIVDTAKDKIPRPKPKEYPEVSAPELLLKKKELTCARFCKMITFDHGKGKVSGPAVVCGGQEAEKCVDGTGEFVYMCKDVTEPRMECMEKGFYIAPSRYCGADVPGSGRWTGKPWLQVQPIPKKPEVAAPAKNANNADAWNFLLTLQWNKNDYDSNAKNRLERGFYGGLAEADMHSCDFYWAQNPDSAKVFYGRGKAYLFRIDYARTCSDCATKTFVEDKKLRVEALPGDILQGKDGGIQGKGVYPADGSFLELDGACNKHCVLIRDRAKPDALVVRCTELTKDCDMIKAKKLEGSAGKYMIEYPCERVSDKGRKECNYPNGKQFGSSVGANTFMQMIRCKAKNLKVQEIPKELKVPAGAADASYRGLNFAGVFHYTEANYKANKGSGELMLFAYKRSVFHLDCDFFYQKPGDAYGMVKESRYGNENALKMMIDRSTLGPPNPFINFETRTPDNLIGLPYNEDVAMNWTQNPCAKHCRLDSSQKGGGGKFETTFWVNCLPKNNDKCANKPPEKYKQGRYGFMYRCKIVPRTDLKRLECGKDKQDYFITGLVCDGTDYAGWGAMLEEGKKSLQDLMKLDDGKP